MHRSSTAYCPVFHPRKIFIARLVATDFRRHAALAIPEVESHRFETYWDGPTSAELERSVGRRRKDRLFIVCATRDCRAYLHGCKDMMAWLRLYCELTSSELLRPYSMTMTLSEAIDSSFRRLTWILRGHELTPLGDYVPSD